MENDFETNYNNYDKEIDKIIDDEIKKMKEEEMEEQDADYYLDDQEIDEELIIKANEKIDRFKKEMIIPIILTFTLAIAGIYWSLPFFKLITSTDGLDQLGAIFLFPLVLILFFITVPPFIFTTWTYITYPIYYIKNLKKENFKNLNNESITLRYSILMIMTLVWTICIYSFYFYFTFS